MPPDIVRVPATIARPSLLLALVAALIVAVFDRRWLAGPVQDLIPGGGPSPERLSRLKARLLGPFEALLSEATRRGRPPRQPRSDDEATLLRELLALVPRRAWRHLPRARRQALVAAQKRLKREQGLTQKRFCSLLGISERTLRSWQKRPSRPPRPASSAPEKPPRRPRRNLGRFDLEVTLPGIQAIADTSAWELFGVPLAIVAVQDPGARQEKLWESFAVDTHEDSALVIDALEEALGDRPGLQVVVDQGTPYMSRQTQGALEELECEHSPQKEGAPTEKATKERAFRTVKDALRPLSELSAKIAERVPALRRPELAKAVGRLLLSVFLRVYEAAPRGGVHPLSGRDAVELETIAEEQRDKARADTRSKKLLLTEIHLAYDFPGSPARTVRAHRAHALEDIQEAERRLRRKACRCQLKACDLYFSGILRNVAEEGRRRRQLERQARLADARQERRHREERERLQERAAILRETPELVLDEALDMIGDHWSPFTRELYIGGRGMGTGRLRDALASMRDQDPGAVEDRAEAGWTSWLRKQGSPDDARTTAIRTAFDRVLAPFTDAPTPSIHELVRDRMKLRPRFRDRPPIRGPDLRNYEAETWG